MSKNNIVVCAASLWACSVWQTYNLELKFEYATAVFVLSIQTFSIKAVSAHLAGSDSDLWVAEIA